MQIGYAPVSTDDQHLRWLILPTKTARPDRSRALTRDQLVTEVHSSDIVSRILSKMPFPCLPSLVFSSI